MDGATVQRAAALPGTVIPRGSRDLRRTMLVVGCLLTMCAAPCPKPTPTYPAGDGWLDLVYTAAADGYDNHDPCYIAKAQCQPPATLCGGRPCAGSTVQLRGNVQCHSGKQTCFRDEAVSIGFATMPLACRPLELWESTDAQLDGNGHGYAKDFQQLIPLFISADGTSQLRTATLLSAGPVIPSYNPSPAFSSLSSLRQVP